MLLATPVFVAPNGPGAWSWTEVGTFEKQMRGYIGKRPETATSGQARGGGDDDAAGPDPPASRSRAPSCWPSSRRCPDSSPPHWIAGRTVGRQGLPEITVGQVEELMAKAISGGSDSWSVSRPPSQMVWRIAVRAGRVMPRSSAICASSCGSANRTSSSTTCTSRTGTPCPRSASTV
jgi:hypothetical protein